MNSLIQFLQYIYKFFKSGLTCPMMRSKGIPPRMTIHMGQHINKQQINVYNKKKVERCVIGQQVYMVFLKLARHQKAFSYLLKHILRVNVPSRLLKVGKQNDNQQQEYNASKNPGTKFPKFRHSHISSSYSKSYALLRDLDINFHVDCQRHDSF